MNISGVERDTGLSKDTLRAWERRYGFPLPRRDAAGQRVYTDADVAKLRLAKRLLDFGYRPGRILAYSPERLQQMLGAAAPAPPPEPASEGRDVEALLALVLAARIDELRRQLSQSLLRLGLARFAAEVVAPLTVRVGDAWSRGRVQIFEEHLYSEAMQGMLRNAISGIPRPGVNPPIVLLTTLPREPHGLGLLMAEACFALEGCRCIALGTQTPAAEIVRAAASQRADIVALSFSPVSEAAGTVKAILELRAALPASAELWVGGSNPALDRRPLEPVQRLRLLTDIAPALARWRKARQRG